MKISMSGIMYDKNSLTECIEAAAKIGYEGIELRGKPQHLGLEMTDNEFAAVKKQIKDTGLEVTSIASFTGDYARIKKSKCQKQLDDFMKYCQMAAELNCRNVRHWTGWIASSETTNEQWDRTIDWIGRAADGAAKYGVSVALELHHGTLMDNYARALCLHREVGRSNVAFIHDAVNLYHDNEEYGFVQMTVLKGLLCGVHMKDVAFLQDKSDPIAYNYKDKAILKHCLIGQGAVDQYSVLEGLKRIGYNGFLTVESSSLLTPYELADYSFKMLKKLSSEVFGK